MNLIRDTIFREYDIRGIVGQDLDRNTAVLLGRAFCSLVKRMNPDAKCLSVGKDVRISSTELADGLMEGMTSSGFDVYDLGTCPTPVQYFSHYHLHVDGGIMVTGSHNPPEYNGFKLTIGKQTIFGSDIQSLKQIITDRDWKTGLPKGQTKKCDINSAYTQYMLKEFTHLDAPSFRRLRIVVDAGNGTAGMLVPEILGRIGCDVVPLYCEPDGTFPNHHPDPTVPEYIQDLIATVQSTGADLGVGYDGDSDRIGVVDRSGTIVWGDLLLILLSRSILSKSPGAKIIADVKCTNLLFEDIEKHGGIPIMWKTGHSLIKQKMREERAPLAGEFSGHIFIGDRYFGYDDAIYTTFRIIEILKETGRGLPDLLSDIPPLSFTPEIRIDCPEQHKKSVVEEFTARMIRCQQNGQDPHRITKLDTIDGVRVVFEQGWGLLRASNTQPVLVMRVEALNRQRLNDYRMFLDRELKDIMSRL